MNLQKSLNRFLFTLFLVLASANSFAETKWEVATVFLGRDEDADFQKEVDANILELKNIPASKSLALTIHRETSTTKREKILGILKKAFKDPKAKKMLIIYGHGQGALGLKDMSTYELTDLLSELNIKLDILWMDACFQANIEFLYQIRNHSLYTIASEEAEFMSGLPFESLTELPEYSNSKEAALFVAKRFIESYSTLKKGEQSHYVSVSSATISVIDNSQVKYFADLLKNVSTLINSLTPELQESLARRLTKNFSMDQKELVDLGHLLIELRKINKDPESDKSLTAIIRLLNIESVKKLRSNPRIKINLPEAGALMVFGYNNWQNGFETEYNENPVFSEIVKAVGFIDGPKSNKWPVKSFSGKYSYITPFAPEVHSFDYYFIDSNGKKIVTPFNSFHRTHDIVEDTQGTQNTKKAGSILVYSAYTQRVGTKAERYTGLNITMFNTIPSLDYYELEFNQNVQWLKL
jgi:hypothetical protein